MTNETEPKKNNVEVKWWWESQQANIDCTPEMAHNTFNNNRQSKIYI